MSYTEGVKTFKAGEALAARVRVKVEGGTVTNPAEVIVAGSGEQHIGVTEYAVADGELVAVRLRNHTGTQEVTADEAFIVGAPLYGAAAGFVKDTSAGSAIGIALEAATAQGDLIEMMEFGVISTTAATVSYADSASQTSEVTVEGALGELYDQFDSAEAVIDVPLGLLKYEDGTIYTKQNSTVSGFAQLSNKEMVLLIPVNASAGDAAGFVVAIPNDLDASKDITVHVLVAKDANNDALTLDCEVFPVGVGDLANADIQDTGVQTIVDSGTELVFTCGADGVIAAPGGLSVVLTQGGTNDGDAVHIHAVWLEYSRKLLS